MTLKTRDWFTKFNAIFREVLLFFLKEVWPLKLKTSADFCVTLWHEPPTFSSSIRKKMKEGVDVGKFRNDEAVMPGMACAGMSSQNARITRMFPG